MNNVNVARRILELIKLSDNFGCILSTEDFLFKFDCLAVCYLKSLQEWPCHSSVALRETITYPLNPYVMCFNASFIKLYTKTLPT